jgi:broad-specificity NMP kinase
MPVLLYIRGVPLSGKKTTSEILEPDLGWPCLWVHDHNVTYKKIGTHKCPDLTDKLMRDVALYVMDVQKRDFMVVRPSRGTWGMWSLRNAALERGYMFVAVQLTATREELIRRMAGRGPEDECRISTVPELDEYLTARPEEPFAGEHVIDTTSLTPEQAAGKVKELLPK